MKKTLFLLLLLIVINISPLLNAQSSRGAGSKVFTESTIKDYYQFLSNGINDFFILEPGYQLILEGKEDKSAIRLIITVLNKTRLIGNVETRIVEENESVNGQPVEISRNFYAFCKQTNSVYYFGEEVDIYKNGKIADSSGAWIAGGNNKPGIAMPGLVLLGSRYYQEFAPGVAMDRAEVISLNETFATPLSKFTDVLKIEETSPLEPLNKEFKLYAPGVGLIKDENLVLVKFGYVK